MATLVIGNGEDIMPLVESLFGSEQEEETLTPEQREERRRQKEAEVVLL